MEILVLFLVLYGLRAAVKDSTAHFGKSKAASRSQHAGSSGPKRAASAVQHDVGYWASQILHFFPQARHGFARGWHDERQRQEQARITARKAKADALEHRVRLIPEAEEHQRRIDEANDVLRREREPEPESESVHAKADEEGEGSPEDTSPAPETAPPSTPTEGSNAMPAADVTYDGVLAALDADRQNSEYRANEQAKALKQAQNTGEAMQALNMDAQVLGAMADHLDAQQEAFTAQQKCMESAEHVSAVLKHNHQMLAEAHKEAPVPAADKEFYAS